MTSHSLLRLSLTVNSVDYLGWSLMCHLVEIGSMPAAASVEQLHHKDLIDFAVEPVWNFDSVVGMGWKHC